ncbi:MAG: DMP19 family protein [Defluviitaleaceae bacterium]|nr:DMP19 family protein [Defluviitaleaceae bacterium]
MESTDLWNRFIDEVYYSFLDNNSKSLSTEQKNAIIAFAYDSEVNNGGHLIFFDTFGNIFSTNDVAEALRVIGGEKFALNFLSAASHIYYVDDDYGYTSDKDDESVESEDFAYYEMNPSLPDLIEAYIVDNKENIFKTIQEDKQTILDSLVGIIPNNGSTLDDARSERLTKQH